MTFLVTYVQEDADRLVTFGPFDTVAAAAGYAFEARAAYVKQCNENRGCGFSVSPDHTVERIARTRVAEYLDPNGAVEDECYFRIDTVRDPASFCPAELMEY